MAWDKRFAWSNDIQERKDALEAFAGSMGGVVKDKAYVWDEGRYLVLHFDLMTINIIDRTIDRRSVYSIINEVVENNGGTRLTESVYLVPLLPGKSSEISAAEFWNTLGTSLSGRLRTGDAFYLHFAPDIKNRIGGIAEVIPTGGDTLLTANIPVR